MDGNLKRVSRFILTAGTLGVAGLLSGCAFNANLTGTSGGGSGIATVQTRLTGAVHGGQQPVSGSLIQLYAVGTTGTGAASTPLISTTVNTNSAGQFAITGDYSCSGATQVYITATGGNAGSGVNSAITLMAYLGSCATLQANAATTFINMNELTTVAAAYVLAPFMADYTHVGASGANPIGLLNALSTAGALVNTTTGQIAAAPTGITLPVNRLNTVANIIAACINSSGPASTQCTTLFNATGASETVGAALAIARSPGSPAITALWTLPTSAPPFVPGLSAQPNDLTLAINYTGSELLAPYGIAIDASGNSWVTNEAGFSMVMLPHPGTAFSTATFSGGGAILAPRGISIDRSGNIWIANTGGNNVVEYTTSGTFQTFSSGGLATPVAVANDSAGNAWVANVSGNSITELSPTGTASTSSPITGLNALATPTAVAVDSTGRVFVANAGTGALCIFTNAAVLQGCSTDGSLFGATGVAVNGSTVAMTGSTTGAAVAGAFTLATTDGTVNSASPVSGGGLTLPTAVAFDANGRSWITNAASISAFAGTSAVTPTAGFNGLNTPAGVAVDPSGNIWTANTGDNSVSIFVGLGTPVATPLAANVGP